MRFKTSRFKPVAAAALAAVLASGLGVGAADAKSCKKRNGCYSGQDYSQQQDRRTASEREYEHTRAKAYDPGGSYDGYPDWARYALSPKSSR